MDRRTFLGSLGGSASSPRRSPPRRSRPGRSIASAIWRKLSRPEAPGSGRGRAFRQGLRELGYVEGQNIVFEYRCAEGRLERLPDLAAELVRLKVDVIVAAATPAAVAAKTATDTIPIVMVAAAIPSGAGLVASLARPGGNVTGPTSTFGRDLVGKQLELLKETVAELSRVAVLWNPDDAAWQAQS